MASKPRSRRKVLSDDLMQNTDEVALFLAAFGLRRNSKWAKENAKRAKAKAEAEARCKSSNSAASAQRRSRYYVYAIRRLDGTPFYIGKGTGRRHLSHLKPAVADTSPKANLIREMLAAGTPPIVDKIREGLTETEAAKFEIATILKIGRAPVGPLLNRSSGGEGCSTADPVEEEWLRQMRLDEAEERRVRRADKLALAAVKPPAHVKTKASPTPKATPKPPVSPKPKMASPKPRRIRNPDEAGWLAAMWEEAAAARAAARAARKTNVGKTKVQC